ncbi:unnamed protein product, partial [Prorocentrum cordatum]
MGKRKSESEQPGEEPAHDARVPKAVKLARDALQVAGVDVSEVKPDDFNVLSPKAVNDLYNAMRHHLKTRNGDGFKEYCTVKTDSERREWLSRFIIDPKSGGCRGFSQTTCTRSITDESEIQWCTIDQLGSANWFNNAERARLVAESGELDSR